MPAPVNGFAKRKSIKYGSTIPSGDLTGFPLLIQIVADADIGAELSSRKFMVTQADGTTEVPYGHYNDFDVAGDVCTFTLRAKFDLDSAASEGDIIGYLYYDDAATDQSDREGVVTGNDYEIFSPLEEDPSGTAPQIVNWTGIGDGTSSGSMTSGDLVAGKVAKCLNFDGNDDIYYYSIGTGGYAPKITFQAWVKFDDASTGTGQTLMSFSNSHLASNGGGQLKFTVQGLDDIGDSSFSDGVWTNVAMSKDESANYVELYFNGVSVASRTDFPDDNGFGNGFTIGSFQSAFAYIVGYLDEVHLASGVNRSADWISFTYNNEDDNGSTVTLGTEEVLSNVSFVALERTVRGINRGILLGMR